MNYKKVKVDIIVEARTQSSRFPGKILKKLGKKRALDAMIERLKYISNVNDIIIATTKKKIDNQIVKIAKKNKVKYFRGSEKDVMKRVLGAAKNFKTDIIVEITGDNPLIDYKISNKVIKFYLNNIKKFDYVSNDLAIHLDHYTNLCPLGFNTKVFSRKLLEEVDKIAKDPIDREHVANYIVKNFHIYKVHNVNPPRFLYNQNFRLTMDYKEDYEVINKVYNALYHKNKKFTAKDIVNFFKKNPKVKLINSHCKQARYNYR
jgi:spore coat polysaccharide biosynthesis protein SpsF